MNLSVDVVDIALRYVCLLWVCCCWLFCCLWCQRRDRQTDRQLHVQPVPTVELTCNPSSFAVYCGVRRSVLASFLQRLSASLCRDVTPVDDDSDVDDGDASRSCSDAALHRLPKVSNDVLAVSVLHDVMDCVDYAVIRCLYVCLSVHLYVDSAGEMKKLQFLTNILVYLENDTRWRQLLWNVTRKWYTMKTVTAKRD